MMPVLASLSGESRVFSAPASPAIQVSCSRSFRASKRSLTRMLCGMAVGVSGQDSHRSLGFCLTQPVAQLLFIKHGCQIGQQLQMFLVGILGYQQGEDEIDRAAVERVELDRFGKL